MCGYCGHIFCFGERSTCYDSARHSCFNRVFGDHRDHDDVKCWYCWSPGYANSHKPVAEECSEDSCTYFMCEPHTHYCWTCKLPFCESHTQMCMGCGHRYCVGDVTACFFSGHKHACYKK